MRLPKMLAALAAGLFICAPMAGAQTFPSKPVRFLTPFPPGAGPEVLLRAVADKLQKRWGQPVLIENRPGANGFIAIDAFRRGATDGHDLIQLDGMSLAAYPHLFKKLPYDPVKDFDALMPMLRATFFFVVASDSKYKSVGDIVAAAKARPGKLNFGSWSVGNPVHLGTTMMMTMTDTQMEHIIYKDANIMYTAAATNELDFTMGTLAALKTFAGRIKPIAVAAAQRYPGAPDVPTVAESGGPPGLDISGWILIAAPKGLPPAVAEKIKRDIEAALAEPDLKPLFNASGFDPFRATRSQFDAFIAAESAKYADVIKKNKISVD